MLFTTNNNLDSLFFFFDQYFIVFLMNKAIRISTDKFSLNYFSAEDITDNKYKADIQKRNIYIYRWTNKIIMIIKKYKFELYT